MQRLMPPKSAVKGLSVQQRIQMYSALIARAQMMYSLGKQYGTDRDVYEALGYETTITYEMYASRYERQDMAAAVIDRPVDATWRGRVELQESPVGGDTDFERDWKALDARLGLKQILIRLDKVSQIGRYGVLLFGFDGTKSEADFRSPIAPGSARKLVYVKPFGEGDAKINQWETDPSNPRYGMPTLYNIVIYNSETQSSREVTVHYSRVLHIVPTKLESEWEGVPALQSIFNRLMDLEKLTGGSAEMFWRGARPGYQAVVDPEYTLAPLDRDDLQDQFDEYEHKLRRILMLEGVEMKALESQVYSPKEHVDVIVQMISAAKGIPKRILTGSEAGELASSQDKGSWLESIDTRRTEYAVPVIIEPFVRRCQEHGILPKLSNGTRWTVKWEDLWSPSDKQQAEIGRLRAEAVRAYGQSPGAETVMPPKMFYKYCLGLDKDEITRFEAEMEREMNDEETQIAEEGIENFIAHANIDEVNWERVYREGGAHWTNDMQPSKFAQEFAQKLVAKHKRTVLEIGCGNGKDSILFALAGLDVTAIDIVPDAIELAKDNSKDVENEIDFRIGNAEELEFDDHSFDAVFTVSVLHSTEIAKSISEIKRVLKSGGVALIYIYSNVGRIDGSENEFVGVNEFIELLKMNDLIIEDIYTDQEEEFDGAGERHDKIIVEVIT